MKEVYSKPISEIEKFSAVGVMTTSFTGEGTDEDQRDNLSYFAD